MRITTSATITARWTISPAPSSSIPTFAPAYFDRGVINYDRRDYDRALTDLNRAVELDPRERRWPFTTAASC